MGKLDPSQQDRWWKSRIEKEELQYGLKQEQSDAAKPATKEVTVLNTLGQPQVKRAIAEPHLTGAGAVLTPRAQQPSRPPTAGPPPEEDAHSVASAAKSVAIKATPGSVASQPRNNKGSQAGTESQSALAKRLDLLEEALAAERVKRLQAEEEMRQLMALQQQQRKKVI
ncbi:hypothetical protein Vretimale_2079 [Volvox reticuliferus]|uniref:Uncharacterized protein n=1 Tax=Volvox reticuliferus TaxID=1737510 RepID=A0A8J4C437_9CHLO|nr:hypothetical protein Vretifemale_4282 [Volvox reticuliferus]GIL96214.1 hypothetical protein Vretimale_2079 [Volvox reticuliferus]